jgi:hypothetical protein
MVLASLVIANTALDLTGSSAVLASVSYGNEESSWRSKRLAPLPLGCSYATLCAQHFHDQGYGLI